MSVPSLVGLVFSVRMISPGVRNSTLQNLSVFRHRESSTASSLAAQSDNEKGVKSAQAGVAFIVNCQRIIFFISFSVKPVTDEIFFKELPD